MAVVCSSRGKIHRKKHYRVIHSTGTCVPLASAASNDRLLLQYPMNGIEKMGSERRRHHQAICADRYSTFIGSLASHCHLLWNINRSCLLIVFSLEVLVLGSEACERRCHRLSGNYSRLRTLSIYLSHLVKLPPKNYVS